MCLQEPSADGVVQDGDVDLYDDVMGGDVSTGASKVALFNFVTVNSLTFLLIFLFLEFHIDVTQVK